MTQLLQDLRAELVRRDYAASTIRSYVQIVDAIRRHTRCAARSDHAQPSSDATTCSCWRSGGSAWGRWVAQISALRFFCRHVLQRRDVREDLPYPKQRLRLPVVLSPDEVQRLIAGAKNLYHRTLLLTLYGAACAGAKPASSKSAT